MVESNLYSIDRGALGSGGTVLQVTGTHEVAESGCIVNHASRQGIRQWPMHSVAESMALPYGQYAEE